MQAKSVCVRTGTGGLWDGSKFTKYERSYFMDDPKATLIQHYWVRIKRRFHFYVAMHVICVRDIEYLLHDWINYFLNQLGYLLLSSSKFFQLHILIVTLRNHGILIFGRMNGKLLQKTTRGKMQRQHVNQTTACILRMK